MRKRRELAGFERVIELFGFKRRPEPWKGLAAGMAGGLAGSLAMSGVQYVVREWSDQSEMPEGARAIEIEAHPAAEERERRRETEQGSEEQRKEESPTEQLAEGIAQRIGYSLSDPGKGRAGSAIHYGYGTVLGGVYGALVEYVPELSAGEGLPFGAGVMVISDEIAVPALGLSPPPTEQPLSTHAQGLAFHLVYGLVCEMTRRGVRHLLD